MHLMIPYQIAYNPISAIIALYILELHGSIIDIAYAATFANFIIIPASIFWGDIVEKYHRRRLFINLSFLGLALSLLGLFLSTTVFEVILLYGFLSFMIMANATPLNLLIMETEPKERWAAAFSRLQMFSSIGGVVSLVFASILAYAVSIKLLILALVPFTILAMIFSFSITEPRALGIRRDLLSTLHSFRSRLLSHHLYFVHPSEGSLGRRLNAASGGLIRKGYFQMLFIAIFGFYLATGLFNTAYPAGLHSVGVSNFDIFAIFAIATAVSTAAFFSLGAFMSRLTRIGALTDSLLTRGFGYVLVGVTFLVLAGSAFIGVNTIIYLLTSGLAYALFYTTMNTMVFQAIGNYNKSYKLGIYSGVVGLGTLIGSFLSGYTSFFVGYWFTFALAGAITVFCAYLFLKASGIKNERG